MIHHHIFVKNITQISIHSNCRIVTLTYHKKGNSYRRLNQAWTFWMPGAMEQHHTVVKFPFVQHQLFWSAKFTNICLTVSLICTIYIHAKSLDLIIPFRWHWQYVHIHLIGFYCSYWLAQVPTFFLIYCSSTATLPKSWHVRTSKLFLISIIIEQH